MKLLAAALVFTLGGCVHYEPPKYPADEKKCQNDRAEAQFGEWLSILSGISLAVDGAVYVSSPDPGQNVSANGSITDCQGPTCNNARPASVAIGAVAIGTALIGLGIATESAHAFDADGCGYVPPPSPPAAPATTAAAPTETPTPTPAKKRGSK